MYLVLILTVHQEYSSFLFEAFDWPRLLWDDLLACTPSCTPYLRAKQ